MAFPYVMKAFKGTNLGRSLSSFPLLTGYFSQIIHVTAELLNFFSADNKV